jgi:hypothetical protein
LIKISPQAKIILPHSAYAVTVSENGRVAVVSRKGAGKLLAPDLTVLAGFSVPRRPSDMALSPDGSELAVVAADGITLYSITAFNPRFEKTGYLNNAYQSCLFGWKGLFRSCFTYTPRSAVLEVWDAHREATIAEVKISDPFGGSAFRLFPHPLKNCALVWMAAGQDGQRLFWASLEGDTIRVSPLTDLNFTSPPAFGPDGTEFLIAADRRLSRHAFPDGLRLGVMNELVDGVYIGDQVCYLDRGHALVASGEGRLFAVDLAALKTLDEVEIVSEGPQRVSEFFRLDAQRFLSAHRDEEATGPNRAGDGLMVWLVPSNEELCR